MTCKCCDKEEYQLPSLKNLDERNKNNPRWPTTPVYKYLREVESLFPEENLENQEVLELLHIQDPMERITFLLASIYKKLDE